MRKADYTTLAALIAEEIRSANTGLLNPQAGESNRAIASARKQCAIRLAVAFSKRASVDRYEFAKACGIDP